MKEKHTIFNSPHEWESGNFNHGKAKDLNELTEILNESIPHFLEYDVVVDSDLNQITIDFREIKNTIDYKFIEDSIVKKLSNSTYSSMELNFAFRKK
ncbi:hypothetical protein [Ferruginibacter profundus]